MTAGFDDILTTLCAKVTPSKKSDFQTIYLIEDDKGARLAFELLVAYGFDAKLYNEQDVSKLYLTLPPADDATGQKLAAALAYAKTLKAITGNLDALCHEPAAQSSDYRMGFSNADDGKQLLIQIAPLAATVKEISAKPAVAATSQPQPFVAQKTPAKRKRPIAEPDVFSGGPAVARQGLIGKSNKPSTEPDGIFKQFWLYFTGHIATVGTTIIAMIALLIAMFSIAMVSKGFLCPDLATVKKAAWYCPQGDDDGK